uniref:Torsin n=1 Tax=Trichuris muris TaxID=70415 RepID=A0A5S6QYF0_TRIMR
MQVEKWTGTSLASLLLLQSSICVGQFAAVIGTVATAGYLGSVYYQLTSFSCYFYECCSNEYVRNDLAGLKMELKQRVYGQHLVVNTVVNALGAHFSAIDKKKPLVLSFHGWTGGGKNYVTSFIARHLYKKGLQSRYVHQFSGSLHFPEPEKGRLYTEQLQIWVRGNASLCRQSLFIFDEVELMPPGVLNGIKTFMEFREDVDHVDFRDCIFIFLSNTAGSEITRRTFEVWKQGIPREHISLHDMEKAIVESVFNEKGGLQYSHLISRSLIDHFIPFLPLERDHVKLCIRDELLHRGWSGRIDQTVLNEIAERLSYFPKDVGLYSSTGCKHVWQKVGLYMEERTDSSLSHDHFEF